MLRTSPSANGSTINAELLFDQVPQTSGIAQPFNRYRTPLLVLENHIRSPTTIPDSASRTSEQWPQFIHPGAMT